MKKKKSNDEVHDVRKCTIGSLSLPALEKGRVYAELPDGYRLIFQDGVYAGRYNPYLAEVI